MKILKFKFIVPAKKISEEDNVLLEININSVEFKKWKKKFPALSEHGIFREMIKEVINIWMGTEEAAVEIPHIKKTGRLSLSQLNILLNDCYFTKYDGLRKTFKKVGFSRFNLKLVESSDDWYSNDPLVNLNKKPTKSEADNVDKLSDLL